MLTGSASGRSFDGQSDDISLLTHIEEALPLRREPSLSY
jgi:hypothetical protein